MSSIVLPDDPIKLKDAILAMLSEGETFRNRERTEWLLTLLYMRGVRNFDSLNWLNGSVSVSYTNQAWEDFSFRYDGIVSKYQTEYGRMMQVDFSPSVTRIGKGLNGLRLASAGQILLNEAVPPEKALRLKETSLPLFLMTGNVGFGAFASKGSGYPSVEVIPPWELMGVPADPMNSSQCSGILRVRWKTEEWLEDRGLLKGVDREKIGWTALPHGTSPEGNIVGDFVLGSSPSFGGGSRGGKTSSNVRWGRFIELWVRSPQDNVLEEYVALIEETRVEHSKFSKLSGSERVPMPVNMARYISVSGFYGKSLMSQFVELNAQAENMLDRMFQNVEDFDNLGLLMVSRGMGVDKDAFTQARNGGRTVVYDQDFMDPTAQPFVVQPANSGRWPVEVIKICLDLMDRQSQQSELFSGDAPGRVDSKSGLSFLFETANIPLTGPASSLSSAISETYKALLWLMKRDWDDTKGVAMTLDDDVLVGVQYDRESGEVTLEGDAVPSPWGVRVGVKSTIPKSDSQTKQDLLLSLESQVITPREYRFKVRELGLEIPVGEEFEWQSYRKAKLENIVLYGDGEEPGEIRATEDDFHEIHLEVLMAFMARPEYELASDKVKLKFVEHVAYHKDGLGELPENFPMPGTEEEAVMTEQAMMSGQSPPPVRLR